VRIVFSRPYEDGCYITHVEGLIHTFIFDISFT